MLKIRCHVRKFLRNRFFPFTTFMLKYSRYRGFLEALIDTGSPYTVVSTRDALRLGFPIKRMQSGESVSLAGFRFFNHPIRNVTLIFRTEEEESFSVSIPQMGILVPTKINRSTLNDRRLMAIPSIIGNDFLEDYGFSLYFNPGKKKAFLLQEQE